MPVKSHTFTLSTKGFSNVLDITGEVNGAIKKSGLRDGIACVFVPGSTAGVTTIEMESGVVEDLRQAIERMAPQNIPYAHDARWGDGNGFSHVRAALLGAGLSVPFTGGRLRLGTWQQLVLIDFDNRSRRREVFVQMMGE
ncbi:MAG: secondary thiamine-phosphate synthase enzyme YjbQ [Nitrospinota bacterium]